MEEILRRGEGRAEKMYPRWIHLLPLSSPHHRAASGNSAKQESSKQKPPLLDTSWGTTCYRNLLFGRGSMRDGERWGRRWKESVSHLPLVCLGLP